MYSIGIDIGTTKISGILADIESGAVIKTASALNRSEIQSKNKWEKIQDPQIIYKAAEKILEELFCDETASIGITGQMHGILYLDEKGEPLSPLYYWQDGRGDLPYNNTTYAGFLKSASGYGNVTHFYNSVNGLTPKNYKTYCTIHDWFAMKICGLTEPLSHISDAASLGLFNLKEQKFECDCPLKFTSNAEIIGKYKNVPVSVAIGDNQASFIGSGGMPGSVLVNVGTGSQVSVQSDKILSDSLIETRPLGGGSYLLVGAALCGGRAFALLESFFRQIVKNCTGQEPESVYPAMDRLLEESCESTLIFDNRFGGTRENPSLRGSIKNIGTDNFTMEAFTAGILKGTAEELYDMYAKMGAEAGIMIGSGNGIRKNKALQKIFSEKFKMPLKIPSHKEEAAYGAMLFSLAAAGHYGNIEEAQKIIKFE